MVSSRRAGLASPCAYDSMLGTLVLSAQVAHPAGGVATGRTRAAVHTFRMCSCSGGCTRSVAIQAPRDGSEAAHAPRPRYTPARPSTRVAVAARLGRLAERLSRVSGLGAGGVVGGRVLLGLAP